MTEAAGKPPTAPLSIAHLTLLVPWVALVIGAWKTITDNSFLWHVRAGTLQAARGSVLTADPFSFTMNGAPWRTQSWLAETLYDWAETVTGGLGFVPFMLVLVSVVTFATIGLVTYEKSASVPATAVALVLSVLALVSFFVPRPVLFSYMLMALVVLAWSRKSTRWALPFLFWIWAGVHASFAIGLVYVALSLFMEREWGEIPKAVVAGLATLATAQGLGVVGFLLEFGANRDALQYLTEWRQPGLLDASFLPILGGLVLIVIAAFRGHIQSRHLWLIVPFTLLSLTSVRAIPMAWLGMLPVVAAALRGLEIGSKTALRKGPALVLGGAIVLLPFLLLGQGGLDSTRFPVDARHELAEVPTFHDDVVGGYLIWAEGPERQVFIDDRAELYGDRLGEMVEVRSGETPWEPVFERDGIEQVLLRVDEPLIADLEENGWSRVYEDDDFAVLRATGA
jgi:hypothetical protein